MADDKPTSSGPLFDGVVFSIIPGEELTEERMNSVVVAMGDNGGRYIELRDDDQSLDCIDDITHVISTHVDFPQYYRCLELGISVVKPSWVRECISKGKQSSSRQHSPDPAQYFQDVVLAFGDLPDGDKEAIAAGVIALGGQPSSRMTKLVTHVVSTSMDNDICRVAEKRLSDCVVVLPHWFDACVKLGKKISEKPYILPDPEILRKHSAPPRPSPTPQLQDATTAQPAKEPILMSPPPSPSKSRKGLAAFKLKRIYFAGDLEVSERLRETLNELVDYGGGKIVNSVDACDIYIGCFRDGPGYVDASRAGKEVANLAWLYHVINRNAYVSPTKKLLHYPVPRHGIPGFEHMRISLSNYSGEARIYIENLIRYSGAEYTKTMKQDNTHLITAHMGGEKCEAAQEWNINIVNHLWLEESYAKCSIQSHANPRYNSFPMRTNLGEITGQTSLDMKSVERHYFPKLKSPQKLNAQVKETSRHAVPASSTANGAPATSNGMDIDVPLLIAEVDGEVQDEQLVPATAKKARGRPRKSNITATPHARKEEKENESPMLTSTGRASKTKALSTLHTQAVDIALYEKEQKRKGGVVYGRRWAADDVVSPAPAPRTSKKRPSDEYDVTAQGSDLSDGETQQPAAKQNKKAKTSNTPTLPPIKYRMMVTGDDRWTDNNKKESADKTTLRQLGVFLTQDPKEVDILVAPKILRTKKFVCALSGAPQIVDSSFLDSALTKKKLVENPPMLKDRDGEERNGFKLKDALARAKKNQRNLFRGWSIYVTKDVKGGFETFTDIVTLNGGTALLYAGRTGIKLADRRVEHDHAESGEESVNQRGEDEMGNVYLVSGESDVELKLWKSFRATAKKQGLEPRIVHTDWLLNAALSQEIHMREGWLLDEEKVMSQRAG